MPNWCNNTLLITADNKKEILLSLKTEFSDFDYNTVIPMPSHQPDVDKPNAFWADGNLGKEEDLYGEENCWYYWSLKHWGVKWNCREALVDEDAGRIDFISPWSPPLAVIEALSAKFPNATFTLYFDESGMQFAGRYTYINGILENKEDLEYEEVNEYEEKFC